jgi:hypothetical protein
VACVLFLRKTVDSSLSKEQRKDELKQVERDFLEHMESTQKKLEKGKG